MPNLAGGQVPLDLATLVDVSAIPASQNVRSTLNDLFAVITRNITDGALRWQGFAAPALSAAGTGAIYFDSGSNIFLASENGGAYVPLIVSGAGTPGGANTTVQYNNAGNFGGISGVTSDGTNMIAASGALRATSPRITTGILDANGAFSLTLSATATAVNGYNVLNAAAGNNPRLQAAGSDTNIAFILQSKGAGNFGAYDGGLNPLLEVTNGGGGAVDYLRIVTGAAAANLVQVSALGPDSDITIRFSPKGSGVFESERPLLLSGTGLTTYTSPGGSPISTKISIPNISLPAFGQILAMGVPSTADASARVITVCDARTVTHQPSIALLPPDESQVFGLSFDGQNIIGYLKNTGGHVGLQGTVYISMLSSAPTDGNIPNNFGVCYLDEGASSLKVRIRDSGGALKTATIAYV